MKQPMDKGEIFAYYLYNKIVTNARGSISFLRMKEFLTRAIRILKRNIFFIILFFIVGFYFFYEVFQNFARNDLYFESDPYYWAGCILNVYKKVSFYYQLPILPPTAYPQAGTFIGAFFLLFLPETNFSTRYYFLKWFPFLNLILIVIIAFVIANRFFKNKKILLFTLLLILLWSPYFIFRITLLVPAIYVTILFEMVLLMELIPGFPKKFVYLTLGTSVVFHPFYGLFLVASYILFELTRNFGSRVKIIYRNRSKSFKLIFDHLRQNFFSYLVNLVFLLLPIGAYVVNVTFRYGTNWLSAGFLYSVTFTISSNLMDFIQVFYKILLAIVAPFQTSGPAASYSWVDPFFWTTIACLFVPPLTFKSSKNKVHFVNLLKSSIIVGFIFFYLYSFIPIIPFGSLQEYLLKFVNSFLYQDLSLRIFEIIAIPSAFLIIITLEELFQWVFSKSWSNFCLKSKKKVHEYVFTVILIFSYFSYTATQMPPYVGYVFEAETKEYPQAITWFREYLNVNDSSYRNIGYSREDNTSLSYFIVNFFAFDYNLTPSDINLDPM